MVFSKDIHHFQGSVVAAGDLQFSKPVQCSLLNQDKQHKLMALTAANEIISHALVFLGSTLLIIRDKEMTVWRLLMNLLVGLFVFVPVLFIYNII